MTEQEILTKMQPIFAQEGVEVEMIESQGKRLLLRARRTGSGVPVAFLMKALEGTLRRYHDTLREVELVEYDPGEGHSTPSQPSEQFQKVLQHQSASMRMELPPAPGLDLRGCERAQAIRALEQAHKMWSRQGVSRFKLRGYSEDAVKRAVEKWESFYSPLQSKHLEADADTLQIVLKDAPPGDFPKEETMWFPARLMLISEPE